MSKFNQTIKYAPRATSYEGGKVYEKDPLEEWINMLFSSYLEDGYYEDAATQADRYIKLVQAIGKRYGWEFVAKATWFARNELGMRSISHLTAALLNNQTFDNKRKFFANFFHRPDDVAEVFAAVDALKEKRSHALVRGSNDYLSTLGEYHIGKYKMKGKAYNMHDLINLTHANSPAINLYKSNMLEAPDTWEVKVLGATSKEQRDQEWKRLVEEGKLGYLALIRNLRNILSVKGINHAWITKYLVPQITNEKAIKKSLVFPYQIYCAYRNLGGTYLAVADALDEAFMIAAVNNMPELDGRTAIMLDVSGSMENYISRNSIMTIKEVGAVYAAALYLGQKMRPVFIKFGSTAKQEEYARTESAFGIIEKMQRNSDCGYGTYTDKAFEVLVNNYKLVDRIFIISDMQVMKGTIQDFYGAPINFDRYAEVCNPHCKCYSFDLGNYATQCANPKNPNVHLLTSLNDKVFEMLKYLEQDGEELFTYINTLSYC